MVCNENIEFSLQAFSLLAKTYSPNNLFNNRSVVMLDIGHNYNKMNTVTSYICRKLLFSVK